MSRTRLAVHVTVVLVGLVALTWPLTVGAHPRVDCRGVAMHAGDVCHKVELDGSDQGRVDTYEARLAAARAANPVVAGTGLAIVAFGTWLLVGETRRRRPPSAP